MKCRECIEHLYEYVDRELTPELEGEIRAHLAACPPCGKHFDFETLFIKFVRVRCRARGVGWDGRPGSRPCSSRRRPWSEP